MGKALEEKLFKRTIKNKVKEIISNKKEELKIREVVITGDSERHPIFPAIILDFERSKETEGRLGPKRLWEMDLGIVCLLRENDFSKGKIMTEEIVGMAADYIIDNLPNELNDVHEVRIAESTDDTLIEIDNKTVVGNAILLEIYYFI